MRALRRLQRDEPETAYVFVSERKAPLTTDAVRKITSVRDNGSRDAAMEIKGKRRFLGLMTVSGKASEQVDEEIERTTVT